MDRSREIAGYTLVERLGQGGTGVVFRALDPSGQSVALKLLHPAVSASEQARVRLDREVRAINRVRNRGVVRVLDVELDGDTPFIVTELVEGVTVSADIEANGPWRLSDLADLASRLKDTIDAIHACGIVHRDLKPSNVMLASSGPVIVDFGTAQAESDERLTQEGLVTGTPGYVPPEVLSGSEPDSASDWWAFAALLLYCATGRPPFGYGNSYSILKRVAAGECDTQGLDDQLSQAFWSALNPDPVRRTTAEVLVEWLHNPETISTEVDAQLTVSVRQTDINAVTTMISHTESTAINAVGDPDNDLTTMIGEPGVNSDGSIEPRLPRTMMFPIEQSNLVINAHQQVSPVYPAPADQFDGKDQLCLPAEAELPKSQSENNVTESEEPPLLAPHAHPLIGFIWILTIAALAIHWPVVILALAGMGLVFCYAVGLQRERLFRRLVHGRIGVALGAIAFPLDMLRGVIRVFATAIGAGTLVIFALMLAGIIPLPSYSDVAFNDFSYLRYLQHQNLLVSIPESWRFCATALFLVLILVTPGMGRTRGGFRVIVDTLMPKLWLRMLLFIALSLVTVAAAYSGHVLQVILN